MNKEESTAAAQLFADECKASIPYRGRVAEITEKYSLYYNNSRIQGEGRAQALSWQDFVVIRDYETNQTNIIFTT